MKKNLKKILLIFSFIITFTLIIYTQFCDTQKMDIINNNKIAIVDSANDININLEQQKNLIARFGNNYKQILKNNTISVEKANKINSLFTKDSKGKIIYPEFFAGQYIDNNGQLIVQVVENNNINMDIYNTILEIEPNTKNVMHSYTELDKVNDIIINYFSKNGISSEIGLVANYIDVPSNKVIVEINNISDKKIQNFKDKVINSNLINFIEGESIELSANLNPGQQLESLIACTMGYRAKLGSIVGYVTAGHCFANKNENDAINTGTIKKIVTSGKVDAAFVATFSSYTPTNTLTERINPVSGLSTTTNSALLNGQAVGKVGAASGAQTGIVTNPSWAGQVGNYYFADQIRTDTYNIAGDSGGPVFLMGINSNASVVGIVSGGLSTGGNLTIVTKASNINSTLGVTRY